MQNEFSLSLFTINVDLCPPFTNIINAQSSTQSLSPRKEAFN